MLKASKYSLDMWMKKKVKMDFKGITKSEFTEVLRHRALAGSGYQNKKTAMDSGKLHNLFNYVLKLNEFCVKLLHRNCMIIGFAE